MLDVPPTAVVESAGLCCWPWALDLTAGRLRHAVGGDGLQDVSTRFVQAPLLGGRETKTPFSSSTAFETRDRCLLPTHCINHLP